MHPSHKTFFLCTRIEPAKSSISLGDWLYDKIGDSLEGEISELNVGLEQFLEERVDLTAYSLDGFLKC